MDTTTGQTSLAGLEDPRVQQLLLEAYCRNISDPDALYGVCSSKTVSKETWMHLYEQEGHWDKSLSECIKCFSRKYFSRKNGHF